MQEPISQRGKETVDKIVRSFMYRYHWHDIIAMRECGELVVNVVRAVIKSETKNA